MKGQATHSSIMTWRIPWTVCIVLGVSKSWTQLKDFFFPPDTPEWENYLNNSHGESFL